MTDAAPRTRNRLLEATTSTNEASFAAADWVLFLSVSAIWGSSFLFIAIGLESLEPGVITLGRVALGALVLNVVPRSRVRFDPADRTRLFVLSVLWVALPFTLFPIAEQHISSAAAGMLNGGMPIFAALVAGVLLRRPPGPVQALGICVGLLGVVAISVGQGGVRDSAWFGIVAVLFSTACYGVAVNIAAPLQQRYGSLPVMARMLALATLCTVPYGIVSIPGSRVEVAPVLAVVFIGAVGTGLAFVLMGALVGSVGSTRASFITYLVPVVALVLGITVRDEHVTGLAIGGVALVIVGAVLGSRPERRSGTMST